VSPLHGGGATAALVAGMSADEKKSAERAAGPLTQVEMAQNAPGGKQ
jgi:hypothetical protein